MAEAGCKVIKSQLKYQAKAYTDHTDRLFVVNLPKKAQGRQIWTYFSKFGIVTDVYLLRQNRSGLSRGCCFVSFKERSVAQTVVDMSISDKKLRYKTRRLKVSWAVGIDKRVEDNEDDWITDDDENVETDAPHATLNVSNGAGSLEDENNMYFDISNLPDVCLINILDYLSLEEQLRCTDVSKHWKNLIEKPVLRKRKEITLQPSSLSLRAEAWERYIITRAGFQHVMRCCGHSLTSLDFSVAKDHLNLKELRFVKVVGSYCKRLTSLKLGCSMTKKDCERLVRHLGSSLKTLVLTSGENLNSFITTKTVYTLFANCKQLENLCIPGSNQLSSKPFRNTPKHLKMINITGCWSVKDDGFEFIADKCKESLEVLEADHCDGLTPGCAKTIGTFPNLKVLSLCDIYDWQCDYGSDLGFRYLSSLTRLEQFKMRNTRCIHDAELREIVRGCKRLRLLDISGHSACLSPQGFASLSSAYNLEHVDVSGQQMFDDDSLLVVGNLPRLTHLIMINCPSVSCEGLREVAPLARHLKSLDLSYNLQIDCLSVLEGFEQCENKERKVKIFLKQTELGKYLRDEVSDEEKPQFNHVEYEVGRASRSTEYLTPFEFDEFLDFEDFEEEFDDISSGDMDDEFDDIDEFMYDSNCDDDSFFDDDADDEADEWW